MKAYILAAVLVFPLMAWSQDEEIGPPLSRAQVFAEANANSSSILTALYAAELTPEEFAEILNGFAENMYVQGYISLAQSKGKQAEVATCVEKEKHYRTLGKKGKKIFRGERNTACAAAANFQPLANNVPACVQADKLLAGAQCCANLKIGVSPSLEQTLNGKKTGEACTKHEDCASQVCPIDDEETAGVCAPVMSCFPGIPLGGECSLENANCLAGVCRPQDLGLQGVTCKPEGGSCSAADDCCSGKCQSGKCQDKYICTECIPEGKKPTGKQLCCRGFIKDTDGACVREMPPFIMPPVGARAPARARGLSWPQRLLELLFPIAYAQEIPGPAGNTVGTGKTSVGATINDSGLTKAQLDMIEDMVKVCLEMKDKNARRTCLVQSYTKRTSLLAQNNAAKAAGKPVGETFTQADYVKRYNIPAIRPKLRSNIEQCEFGTLKDGWLDASNLQRNAELFTRAFEVSYSGKGTQDFWHLPNASGTPHPQNLYTRTKGVMSELRENRLQQRDQLRYLDLMMACQCIYTFGPEKFSAEKQAFFFSTCTGQEENKICRAGSMQESLKLPDSPEEPYREGKEFPNYVAMYFAKLEKMAAQGVKGKDDIDNLDSSAAGINHEEVLVRWLRMRSCNQVDVFVDTEKLEGELQALAEDLHRAKKPNSRLTNYWTKRLQQMKSGGVAKEIIEYFAKDPYKDTHFRGYVDTETKTGSKKKKTPKFLFFLVMMLLGLGAVLAFGFGALGLAGLGLGGAGIAVGVMMGGGGASGVKVVDTFLKDFPNPIIETRLVEKKSCVFGLFWCKKFYTILHWPAYSNGPGIEHAFPFVKREERTCDQTASIAASLPGAKPNGCSGSFKGTMCARSFLRPLPDGKIAGVAEFAPWKEVMKDKMLMDPVYPDFMETGDLSFDYKWKEAVHAGFKKGCAWAQGKKNANAKDKLNFLPDLSTWTDGNYNFLPKYQMTQARIDAYKAAVEKYALCADLRLCEAKSYDGKHPLPDGFIDIIENGEQAKLFADYVYQIHFQWRHMSDTAGIGYPLAYLEQYYLSLLHNVRLLTTLSIRRAIELDDAYLRYAEDLAIRRGQYQISGNKYGVTMGQPVTTAATPDSFFRSLSSLANLNLAAFPEMADAGTLDARGQALVSSVLSGNVSATDRSALAAAARNLIRGKDEQDRWKNYQQQTSKDPGAGRRLAAAAKFFTGVNAPTASIASLANPKDSSSYSGVGGVLDGKGPGKPALKTVKEVDSRVDGAGSGTSSVGDRGGFGGGSMGTGDFTSGVEGTTSAEGEGELAGAAKVTGMREGDVQTMLEEAERQRGKDLQAGESDSLFEKVSKAYFRNMDRVLILRKGEAPAAVPGAGADKEKDEIKQILGQ